MIITLHGLSTMHCNISTEIRIANEEGFGGIEIIESKLLRYIENGQGIPKMNELLLKNNIKPVCINALKNIEVQSSFERREMLLQCETLCKAAQEISCPTIQLVPFCSLEDRPVEDVLQLTSMNLKEIASIGEYYGVRFQLEPIAFSPINSLKLSMELIEMTAKQNVGMVIDFWHLWAGGDTQPHEVSNLNKNLIYGVHFCDGKKNPIGAKWDEAKLRSYLPGDGDIDIPAWVKAVKSTGYDWSWSSELYSPYHWEIDLKEIAKETKQRMENYILD